MIKVLEQPLTDDEILAAEAALNEFEQQGKAKTVCPRCKSSLDVRIGESGEFVKCVKCEFRMTLRGI
ncbi:MAG: hypothetical protein ACK5NT_14245 [Pyrinomonadaceae bacterium]